MWSTHKIDIKAWLEILSQKNKINNKEIMGYNKYSKSNMKYQLLSKRLMSANFPLQMFVYSLVRNH